MLLARKACCRRPLASPRALANPTVAVTPKVVCCSESSTVHVLVASKNPVKINAADYAVRQCLHLLLELDEEDQQIISCQGVESDSGVPPQPIGDDETLLG